MQWPSIKSNSNGNTNKNALDSSSEIGYVNHQRAESTYKRLNNILYPLQHTGSYKWHVNV